MNAVLSFWLAYILTRPLGASIGDEMSQTSHKYGGLGLGTTGTSYIFLACIFVLVVYLTKTKRAQPPRGVVLGEGAGGGEPPHTPPLPHPHVPHPHLPHPHGPHRDDHPPQGGPVG